MKNADVERIGGWDGLAFAIVERAVIDWIQLCKHRLSDPKVSLEELERFFLSGYCDFLLQDSRLTGPEILRELKRQSITPAKIVRKRMKN